jgi:tRNA (guanine-N7-)-methyltransferase
MSEAAFVPENYFRELKKEELFQDASRPLEIDLGCGDGRFLLGMAAQHPERNFLGVERMLGRYDKVAKRITQAGLSNARVLRLESSYTVAWLLPTASVSRLHLLCPDPWPKKKHHRRRLVVSEEFHQGLQRILVPGGEFLLKTDDADYYAAATEQFDGLPAFTRLDWPEDAFFYPQTDFERQWLSAGRDMHRARWQLAENGG